MNTIKQDLKKNQILDAAMKVITQNGYENSRMDDVVKRSESLPPVKKNIELFY